MNSLSKVGAIAGSILFLSSSSISLAGGSHDKPYMVHVAPGDTGKTYGSSLKRASFLLVV